MTTADTVKTPDGVEIFFETAGQGDPIVFLHGITEDRQAWNSVCGLLGDYQTIRIDARGHGRSGRRAPYDLRTLASDVHCVMRTLRIEGAHVVGHSMGGATATFVASIYGARSVINVEQPMDLDALVPLLSPIADDLRSAHFTETIQQLFSAFEGENLPTDVRRELAAYHTNANQEVVLGCWDFILNRSPEWIRQMVDDVIPAIRVPYLSLHGLGPATDYEKWLRARVPSAVVEAWPGGGHWPHRANPARFAARLRDFLGVQNR